ncbi:hypothetical protein AVEN_60242-1, partial [Araneus ventricosus]
LVMLTSCFEARGPRSFGLQSDDDDDTRAGTSLSKLPIHISGSLTHVRFN